MFMHVYHWPALNEFVFHFLSAGRIFAVCCVEGKMSQSFEFYRKLVRMKWNIWSLHSILIYSPNNNNYAEKKIFGKCKAYGKPTTKPDFFQVEKTENSISEFTYILCFSSLSPHLELQCKRSPATTTTTTTT